MERFEMPMPDPEAARIGRLAERAAALAPSLDLSRAPDGHVHKALDEAGIRDLSERKRLIPAIKKELHRKRPKPFSARTDLIEDARIQELRHPKDDEDEA